MRIFITAKFEVSSIADERTLLSDIVEAAVNNQATLYDLQVHGAEKEEEEED